MIGEGLVQAEIKFTSLGAVVRVRVSPKGQIAENEPGEIQAGDEGGIGNVADGGKVIGSLVSSVRAFGAQVKSGIVLAQVKWLVLTLEKQHGIDIRAVHPQ